MSKLKEAKDTLYDAYELIQDLKKELDRTRNLLYQALNKDEKLECKDKPSKSLANIEFIVNTNKFTGASVIEAQELSEFFNNVGYQRILNKYNELMKD